MPPRTGTTEYYAADVGAAVSSQDPSFVPFTRKPKKVSMGSSQSPTTSAHRSSIIASDSTNSRRQSRNVHAPGHSEVYDTDSRQPNKPNGSSLRKPIAPMRRYGEGPTGAARAAPTVAPAPATAGMGTKSPAKKRGFVEVMAERAASTSRFLYRGRARSRSVHRPSSLSKAPPAPAPAVPIVPPALLVSGKGGAARRSQSAPPEGVADTMDIGLSTAIEAIRRSGSGDEQVVLTAIGSGMGLFALDPVGGAETWAQAEEEDRLADEAAAADLAPGVTSEESLGDTTSGGASGSYESSDFVVLPQPGDDGRKIKSKKEGDHDTSGMNTRPPSLPPRPPRYVPAQGPTTPPPKPRSRHSRFGTPPASNPTEAHVEDSALDDELMMQAMELETQRLEDRLTTEQKIEIAKNEADNNEALSRVIREEGKMGQKTLSMAISELEELQKVQRQNVRLEASALTNHTKTLGVYTKALALSESARSKYDDLKAKAQLASLEHQQAEETLEEHKFRVQDAMNRTKDKKEEVEFLRKQFGVEERVRVLHLEELKPAQAEVQEGEVQGTPGLEKQALRGSIRFGIPF